MGEKTFHEVISYINIRDEKESVDRSIDENKSKAKSALADMRKARGA